MVDKNSLEESIEAQIESLREKTDDELWRVVEDSLDNLKQVDRDMKVLIDKRKQGIQLSEVEQAELAALSNNYNDLVLLRTEALVELQERGHDIQSYIESVTPKP